MTENESNNEDIENLVKAKTRKVLEIFKLFEVSSKGGYFKEIKYFSPDGSTMPNGIGFQRGNFLHECKVNREAFVLDETIHDKQYGLADYRGGIIVFSTDVNAVSLDKNKLKYNGSEFIGACSIGNAFKGNYVGDNGEEYDERSTTIEVNGLPSQGLLRLAEMVARMFHQETVLVKDFNNMKLFLAKVIL